MLHSLILALALARPSYAAEIAARPEAPMMASPSWATALGRALPGLASLDRSLAGFAALDFSRTAARVSLGPLVAELDRDGKGVALRRDLVNFRALPEARKALLVEQVKLAHSAAEISLARRLAEAERAASDGRAELADLANAVALFERYDFYGPAVDEALRSARMTLDAKRAMRLAKPFEEKIPEAVPASSSSNETAPLERATPRSPSAPGRMPSPPKPRSNLAVRATTAVFLVPGIVALTHLGGLAFTVFIAALAALCASEYAGLMNKGGRQVSAVLAVAGAAAVALFPSPLSIGALAASAFALEVFRQERSLERAAFTAAGAILLGAALAPLIALRSLPHGEALALLVFVSAWFSDTAAMLVGKKLGRRKLAPYLSPNKTWEGALGGFAGALLAGAAFHLLGGLPWLLALGVGAIVGSLGQVSGLMNSMIKRLNGAKDSGTLLPGHGGFLDRFDTLLLSSIAVYALALLLR